MPFTPRIWLTRLWLVLWGDIRAFYAPRNLVRLGLGFLLGALLANTPLDQWLFDTYQEQLHATTPAAATCQKAAKQIGERETVILAPLAAMGLGLLAPAHPATAAIGLWGTQFTRTFLAAAPLAYGATWLLGGDRPKNNQGSHWQPWRGKQYGISGHAMAGSISFLVVAGMSANPVVQTVCYAGSGLCAWSRLDSRSHYPSQLLLGWWLSFLAMRIVRKRIGRI
jgi:hypothetical protein